MSENTSSRLRFAINLGNAVLAHLGETGEPAGLTVELSHRLATALGRHRRVRPLSCRRKSGG